MERPTIRGWKGDGKGGQHARDAGNGTWSICVGAEDVLTPLDRRSQNAPALEEEAAIVVRPEILATNATYRKTMSPFPSRGRDVLNSLVDYRSPGTFAESQEQE